MNNKQKKLVLDPLTTLFKLAILKFYPVYTKLSFTNYQIHIQPPTYLQGSMRYFYGDTREDLHNLHNPILRVIQWYPCNTYDSLYNIYKLAIQGINMLKNSYSSDGAIILHSLDLYNNLINNHLNNIDHELQNDDTRDNNIFKEQLLNMWDISEIKTIINLILLVEKKYTSNMEHLYIIDSINCILANKDFTVESIIEQHITTL